MSEYWKSNPRKFCDFCKCWIADNRPSIEFHERGKRHKENVQIRLAEISKKGKEDYENKLKEDDYMKEMEEAALKAYKKDLEKNPDMTGNKITEIAQSHNAEIVVRSRAEKESEIAKAGPMVKKWYEAKTTGGVSYYWNVETGESSWEAPTQGFLSIVEQQKLQSSSDKDTKKSKIKTRDESETSSVSVVYGPAPKAEMHSPWTTVEKAPVQQVDLQLPDLENEYVGPELSFQRPEVTFKEKTVTLSNSDGTSGSTSFKRRKGGDDQRKKIRRRDEDL